MKPIVPFSITAPGYWGLNTQDSPSDMDQKFALEAMNCVIDRSGRLVSRKGWTPYHATSAELGTEDVMVIGEAVSAAGVSTIVCAGNDKLFKLTSGTPNTLTELTYGGGGVAPTISASNWQVVKANGAALFWQRGHDPLVFDPSLSATTYRRISEHPSYAGAAPQANCALSAFGRVWCADTATDKNTITFTDTLTYMVFTGGTSGTLNLYGVWPDGGDEIVALAAHNNFLVIFGKRQVLIYANPDDPANMKLADNISNSGCVGRDTVVNTPSDLIFLSANGVISLGRVIQEKSSPIRSISANVDKDIREYFNINTSADTFKAVYSPADEFYLLTFSSVDATYCFDTRTNFGGALRATTWYQLQPKCYYFSQSLNSLLIGFAGYIGTYSTYKDNGVSYRMYYSSPWIDFGNPIQTSILKKIIATSLGAVGQPIIIRWGIDYDANIRSQTVNIADSGSVAEYGVGEYGIGEYNTNVVLQAISVNAGGAGKVIQCSVEVPIDGNAVSLQRLDIFTKDGSIKS